MRGVKQGIFCIWDLGSESCEEKVDGRGEARMDEVGRSWLSSPADFAGGGGFSLRPFSEVLSLV
ncbi:hypothetical protein C1H46_030940 [Malus baccata]|uniref:Uncharacterized protein n=1 Tax=Malus baccata TaxID=106549 RepID=A0A540LAX7_MALBA|nr:hypothetical protein C1H46_030940 [Malus baccata]